MGTEPGILHGRQRRPQDVIPLLFIHPSVVSHTNDWSYFRRSEFADHVGFRNQSAQRCTKNNSTQLRDTTLEGQSERRKNSSESNLGAGI